MFSRIAKVYRSNPILFVHIAGFALLFFINILLELFRLAMGWEALPEIVRDAFITIWSSGFLIWLGITSQQCSKKHKQDEVKLTYVVLKLYSFATTIAGAMSLLSWIIVLISDK